MGLKIGLENFKEQLENSQRVTKELLETEGMTQEYTSGRKKEIGDLVLFAFELTDVTEIREGFSDINLKLIQLHQEELGELYHIDYDRSISSPLVPVVTKK
jgi:hypothetical protein